MNDNGKNKTTERPIIQVVEAPKNTGFRKLIIALAVGLCLAMTGYALNVNSFTDYNPPDYLSLQWHDLYGTATPRWSAEYPYRAIFLSGRMTSSSPKQYDIGAIVVYSKKPTTDLFTFEYMSGDKTTMSGSKRGYIRAYFNQTKYNATDCDIQLVFGGNGQGTPATYNMGQVSNYQNYDVINHKSGTNYYFDFDFFYDCAEEHTQAQTNAQNLNINGIKSISGTPYGHIIHCLDHTGYTGGADNGGGSSSNGGKKWGNGENGGGIDWGSGGAPTVKDYESKYKSDDMKYSTSDKWKTPYDGGSNPDNYSWELDANIPKPNFQIPIPEFKGQGEGDTGYSGGTLPDFSDIPTGSIDFNFTIPQMPNRDKITFIGTPPDLYINNNWPPKYPK